MFSTVLRLPEVLVGELCSEWLEAKSLAKFDSSVCSSEFRPPFLGMIANDQFTHHPECCLTMNTLKWSVNRQLKLSNIKIVFDRHNFEKNRIFIQSVNLNFDSSKVVTMSLLNCYNLSKQHLRYENFCIPSINNIYSRFFFF